MLDGHVDNVLGLRITDGFGLVRLHGLALRTDKTPLTVTAIPFILVATRALALCRETRVVSVPHDSRSIDTHFAADMMSRDVSYRGGSRLAGSARDIRRNNAPIALELVLAAGRAVQHSARPLSRLTPAVGLGVAVVGHDGDGDEWEGVKVFAPGPISA